MNKFGQVLLAVTLSLSMSSQSMAAFVLNGTRFIYEEGKKNISFEVTNQADDTYGGQVWIDNTTQGKEDVFMVPAPPFFKVKSKQSQVIRIMNVDSALPKDRESLFWLNVQEVPPKPKESEGNVLAIAMNTQVKLIYRPKVLIENRKNAEEKVTFVQRGGITFLKNPTPYYFAVVDINVNGKKVKLTSEQDSAIARLAPFSEVSLGNSALKGKVTIGAVNDWGGIQTYPLKASAE